MNCLCNFFDDNLVWVLIIILILLLLCNNGSSCGCSDYNNGCGCSR